MKKKIAVYVGTYTCPIKFGTGQILEGKGKGIYHLELDMETGKLIELEVYDGVNPSYLVLSHTHKNLYAVNELKEFEGKASGSVSAFGISENDGRLHYINKQATGGLDPCHVEINSRDSHIYVSNFMTGSVCIYPLGIDGSIGAVAQFIQHEGSSVNPERQAGPHAHSLTFSVDGNYAFVPDLGLDKIMIYRVDKKTHTLDEARVSSFTTRAGAGPRCCIFDNTGKYCYLINELDCTIVTLSYCADQGSFIELQKVSSLPAGVDAPGNTCADVHITPNGAFLYGSNRGHDSLVIYKIDQETGLLTYAGCQPCAGKTPRNFAIDPTGRYLLCANQDTDAIVVFEIDYQTGALTLISEINIPTPVCVKIRPEV